MVTRLVARLVARHWLLFGLVAVSACDVDCGDEEDLMRMTLLQMSLTMPRGEVMRTASTQSRAKSNLQQQEPAMVKLDAATSINTKSNAFRMAFRSSSAQMAQNWGPKRTIRNDHF